ncbi:MAG: DNA protecting protein DprA [Candidatus Doudnabacteria bacterium RIFCSPHIGHO2_02_FULL_48_21]|uniref:DNA protecting protein DprA n=1 Tax=Candidatus Doudnabacteria bacterium RIFCSPLOWO2_02_FULL_48_13 TaxID=1817845 RepID=A0A1F5QD24_9BACT|nr:MAG: DNA protecting protein DprA [Candidatus Doudnabacteria bacterium RIFCSPHIGHO2_12_FULL_47_25]OGE93166.1 MAG: DNA protecting protein DprA [Candidatus Doudnabacteria bacterium RIFCSPHIGHO2_02_FULL_48_21]OGE96561.1 MAG: DNA protecting protein DprA [Candidatus Doudnabacteria bacterium RIFCSPLOWO2_01_FULL_48_57]OGF00049.1 MAG: DNA protecting protein DprA [Candidatus Doudnabacteria bacterium RIFCSPLOWO2_02_FULL_48_13]OGF01167.1 MAG: DNA protecting protein DprA [Candidatus Doudnabacteria bacter
MNTDHPYFNAFNTIPQIGPVKFAKLLNFFPNLQSAWQASPFDLAACGLEQAVVEKILETRQNFDPIAEFARLEKLHVELLTIKDQLYPKLLKEIPSAPAVLYVLGRMLPSDEMAIAVVGTRKFSTYGKQATAELVTGMVRANLTIVSGLALGIDSLAHRTAVECGGRTIAVLACGVDNIYPALNRHVAQQILDSGGAIISELPLGTPPLKHHFPNRNRIISGMSLGTLVIEAAAESGSLITAQHALDQNRQIFAVPGSIFNPGSEGPNNLLKMGAKAVTRASDILEDLNLDSIQTELITQEIAPDNEEEAVILGLLKREPTHVDIVVKTTGLPAATVAATLTIMEMKGKVRNLGANQYVISR